MRVAAIGDNCLDAYVEQDRLTVGGNAANVAAAFARLGHDSTYVGAVGSDEAAEVVVEVLGAAVLHPDFHHLSGATGVTLIELSGHDREFLHEDFGVGQSWSPDAQTLQALDVDWTHVAGSGTDASVRRELARLGRRVSIDLSTGPIPDDLHGLEVVFASWEPGGSTPQDERARQILAAGATMAVLTGGASSSLAMVGHRVERFAALPILPMDTLGAGDSFIAGFLASHLRGEDLPTGLAAGTAVASATCLHLGGFPQRPRAIPSWLRQKYADHFPAPAATVVGGRA